MDKQSNMPSFLADVRTLPAKGFPVKLSLSDQELPTIARLLDVTSIENLDAELLLKRWRRDGVQIEGRIRAKLDQPCRLTLEPVIQDIDEDFHLTFVPEDSKLARYDTTGDGEIILDPDGDDLPDMFSGSRLDLWPVIFEQLVLAIDPFPQAPGAKLENHEIDERDTSELPESPFAVLSALKSDKKLNN
ncbi:MAG: DUF177 domain-containing protein [Pseudomonadota bacterium]